MSSYCQRHAGNRFFTNIFRSNLGKAICAQLFDKDIRDRRACEVAAINGVFKLLRTI
jgi:hypothetical protein